MLSCIYYSLYYSISRNSAMKLSSAILTLFLVMDPLGNIPPFLSVLKDVHPDRRRRVLMREILIAYVVLLVFLFLGKRVLALLSLQQETISIAGGIVLFLIALRMIFPTEKGLLVRRSKESRSSCRSRFRLWPAHLRWLCCCC